MAQPPHYPCWAIHGGPLPMWAVYILLDCCWHINGRNLLAGWSASRTGCHHQPPWRIDHWRGWAHPPYKAILTSAGIWCSLRLPLECVACWLDGALMFSEAVHQGCWLGGPPQRCRPKSATTCVLCGITWHKLWSNLQLELEVPR